MFELYTMLFEPVFKNYIWGGRNLEKLGRKLPNSGIVAESWEISSHQDGMTKIANGPLAGKTLQDVFLLLGKDLVGTNNKWALDRAKFPLLVKLLDANEKLSIQVHPNDAYALQHEENELGKTEMWVILDADPGAEIILGLSKKVSPDEFQHAINENSINHLINRVNIKAGDHICVPAGTLHAILGGAIIAEIQQNSNTTYRVYDWGRVDDYGRARPLHVEKALDVINFNQIQQCLPNPMIIEKGKTWHCERLCKNKYFTTDRYLIHDSSRIPGNCDGTTLEIWGVLTGEAVIGGEPLSGVQFVLLPASLGLFVVEAERGSVLLRTFVE